MSFPKTLRFGIQSLDKLIGIVRPNQYGVDLLGSVGEHLRSNGSDVEQPITSSICVTGPDGTGKSVFSLHLAAHYLGDSVKEIGLRGHLDSCPMVFYISTDLSYKMALKGWQSFALDYPFERREPLVELKEGRSDLLTQEPSIRVSLKQYLPIGGSETSHSIVDYLEDKRARRSNDSLDAAVCFVDLASSTAGDDWGFVHRLLSTLEQPKACDPRHLVILDAVEGFETLVGELNAFGEPSTRRSRIAQAMRLAAGKCHLLYVIEELREQRLPEEFVTDVVVRLRNVSTSRYLRRTVEIEKSRGQLHVRGQHPFVIRDGTGSSTGNQENADDPIVRTLSTSLLSADDFDGVRLIQALTSTLERPSQSAKSLRNLFSKDLNTAIDAAGESGSVPAATTAELLRALNDVLVGPCLEGREGFSTLKLPERVRRRITTRGQAVGVNRRLLEDAFPNAIFKSFQSYIHVFPSLNRVSREIMNEKFYQRQQSSADRFAAFGITYLDNMLGGSGEKAERARNEGSDFGFDTRGLPCGSATALIGDSLTQKSQLGQAFLSRAFYPQAQELANLVDAADHDPEITELENRFHEGLEGVSRKELAQLAQRIAGVVGQKCQQITITSPEPRAVVVVFTTQDLTNRTLAESFCEWLRHVPTEIGRSQNSNVDDELDDESDPGRTAFPTRSGKNPPRDFADAVTKEVFSRIASWRNEGSSRLRDKITELKRYLKGVVFEHKLKEYMESHTICRRLELHDIPGPVLIDIFQRSIQRAQRIMTGTSDGNPLSPPERRYQESWRIRVVIDDLNSFRNTYPEVRDDPLVLPALLFNLGREGVTPLIIDTQPSGSPDLSLTERFDSSVRQLVQNHIYTWRVSFYGENRIAIAIIPPISDDRRGVIRELRWETSDRGKTDRALSVDPHFELYMGLEGGQPQPVPLEIRLVQQSPSTKRYFETEEILCRQIFTPLPNTANDNPCVIRSGGIVEYNTLRDSCHLQRDTRLDHTAVVQVDEFWWLPRPRGRLAGAFRPQWNYLNAITATRNDAGRCVSEPAADPFGVFQPSMRRDLGSIMRRVDFFDPRCGYSLKGNNLPSSFKDDSIDRVPFTWDFGFLLCNSKAWNALPTNGHHQKAADSEAQSVWQRLTKLPGPEEEDSLEAPTEPGAPVSWFEFLKATKHVAEFQAYRTSSPAKAFDFTMLTPESFSCLILEMWASEIYSSLSRHESRQTKEAKERKVRLVEHLSVKKWKPEAREPRSLLDALSDERQMQLCEILEERRKGASIKGYTLELYKVWLLLLAVLDFSDLVDSSSHLNFEFKSRDVSPQAVSARHWYSTASKFTDSLTPEQLEYNWVPVRLPGHFSVRGDWFLAVSGGSRSSRLADHALDLLSSKRANITRLQEGIGLPTRILRGLNDSHLRTRLICAGEHGPLASVEYEALRKIGAPDSRHGLSKDQHFYWLWRSGIASYNRHSRIWHRWLNRTLLWWNSWRQRYGSNWAGGFSVYEKIDKIEFNSGTPPRLGDLNLKSWAKFHELRNILIEELEDVSTQSV